MTFIDIHGLGSIHWVVGWYCLSCDGGEWVMVRQMGLGACVCVALPFLSPPSCPCLPSSSQAFVATTTFTHILPGNVVGVRLPFALRRLPHCTPAIQHYFGFLGYCWLVLHRFGWFGYSLYLFYLFVDYLTFVWFTPPLVHSFFGYVVLLRILHTRILRSFTTPCSTLAFTYAHTQLILDWDYYHTTMTSSDSFFLPHHAKMVVMGGGWVGGREWVIVSGWVVVEYTVL